MASIQKRGKKYCVIYRIYDDEGKAQQKWETYDTEAAAKKRKLEVEYKLSVGTFEVQKCVTVKELLDEYVNLYGREKWSFSTYDGNISTINNYIIPTIGNKKLDQIDNHFIEKYYQELLDMPAVKSSRNMDESGKITAATVGEIHKILRSCFRQAVKWGIMNKNPATDATVPKHKKEEREIWTAEMLMQAIEACENRWLKIAFHLSFTATLRLGELLGLTWDCVEISQKAIDSNSAYIIINKEVERISKKAVEALKQKDIIQVFPSMRKNNRTVRVLKAPKTDSSIRKVYIPSSVAILLAELREEQKETIEALGDMYENYNLVLATSYGLPLGESYLRDKMQEVIDREGLPDVVFHSLRHPYVKHTTKIFSLRLMDFQAQAYPDARRKTRGACQLLRVGQSRSPVRPLYNRKRFSCLPPQSKMSWILYAISMRLSGYTSTRSISSSASSVVSASASKIALDASFRLSCRACSSCFCFACANTAA